MGEGYDRGVIEQRIAEARAEGWLRLTGFVHEDEKVDWYRHAWLLAERVGPRGLGDDGHRGGRVRYAVGSDRHRRSPRRRRARTLRASRGEPGRARRRDGTRAERRRAAARDCRPARSNTRVASRGAQQHSELCRCCVTAPRGAERRRANANAGAAFTAAGERGSRSPWGSRNNGDRSSSGDTTATQARLRRDRAPVLRAAAVHAAWQGRRRHQELPLHRPGAIARSGCLDVGPEHRLRHRHAPEHRLPVPDGTVVLRVQRGPRADVGGPAPLARHDHRVRRVRRALPRPRAGDARARRTGGGAALHVQPVLAALRVADLGAPRPVGRVAVDDRAHVLHAARRRMALSRDLRPRGATRRRRERHRADLRRARAGALDHVGAVGDHARPRGGTRCR